MKRLMFLAALLAASPAFSADWLALQGTEPDNPDKAKLRGWGFLQMTADGIIADPVEGLVSEGLAPYNGEKATFNLVGPDSRSAAVYLRRVRAGMRGEIPGTNGLLSTFAAVELGFLPLTLAADGWRPALMDASFSVHGPKNISLRVGRMKAPLADESLESVQGTADLIVFSQPVRALLMERNTASGMPEGRVNGFRDDGAQLFGAHHFGMTELSWAAFVGQGGTLQGPGDAGWDVIGRVQVARLFDESQVRNPLREEVSLWAFGQTGQRAVGEDDLAGRHRVGVGTQVRKGPIRFRSEFLWGQGVLNSGQAPPFPGGSQTLDVDGTGWGLNSLAMATVGPVDFGAAYAHYARNPGDTAEYRSFDELTGIVQWNPLPVLWLNGNVAWRQGNAPNGPADAQTILDTYGIYVGGQVTFVVPGPAARKTD